jgi:segregation and condensation protein A
VFRPDLESFSGPFELLLYLIHKDEVDIFDIPIAGILKQFLQHVRDLEASGKLDLQESGEYLVMAARLMEIKSRMLLPDDAEEEEDLLEAETEDPRWSLVQQLLEFSVIKQRAELLERAHRSRSLAYERLPGDLPPPEPGSLELRETSTLDLRAAFQRVLDLLRERDAVRVVPGEEIPIEVAMAGIRDQLLEADNRRQPFSTLFPRDLGLRGLISYFMALLELTRLRHLQLEQNDDFGDILVILREAA